MRRLSTLGLSNDQRCLRTLRLVDQWPETPAGRVLRAAMEAELRGMAR